MKIKQLLAALTIGAIGMTGAGLAVAPAFGSEPTPRACALAAQTPSKEGGTLMRSYGGRGNCSNSATVTVMLKRDISGWPDTIVASQKYTQVLNYYWNVYGNGAYGSRYYTQTDSSTGAALQSSRITL